MPRAISMRVRVVVGHVVGHAGLAAVHVGAAELFGRHHLAGRSLHQRRAAEKDGALVPHDDASSDIAGT